MQLSVFAILTKVFTAEQIQYLGLYGKFVARGILFFEYTLFGGVVVVPSTILRLVALYRAIAHTHRKVCIARHKALGIHYTTCSEVLAVTLIDIEVIFSDTFLNALNSCYHARHKLAGGILLHHLIALCFRQGKGGK